MDPLGDVQFSGALVLLDIVPPRVEAFCWRAVASKIMTIDILRRKGVITDPILDIYSLCGRERELIDHLFVHCNVACFIWGHFLKLCGAD